MKGLLHRLAERTAGTAVRVRSDARLPYGADGLAWGDAPANLVAWAPEEATSVAAPAKPVAPAPEEAVPAAVPEQLSRSNVDVFEQDRRVDAVFREPATPQPGARPFSRGAPPPHEASTKAVGPVAALEALAAERINAPPQPMLPTAGQTREPVAMPPEGQRRAARLSAAPAWNESPPSLRGVSADPAPLLPAAQQLAVGAAGDSAARLSAPQRSSLGRPLATSVSAGDEATEVHIHIGRIDVTAVHEAPKVRAKPRTKSPAVSLDAYLAARSQT